MKRTFYAFLTVLMYVGIAALLSGAIPLSANAELGPQQRLMAKRAAKADALRNMAELVYGVQINSRTKVQDFITQSDTIRARLNTVIQGAREIDYVQRPDGTAEVTVELTLGSIEDIVGRQLMYDQQVFTATGYGAPPGEDPGAVSVQPPAPVSDVIRAKGNGVAPSDPSMSQAEKMLMAKRAAKIDALRNLLEQVYGVNIRSNTTVRDFVTERDDIRARVRAFVQGARVVSEESLGGGMYEVVVEIDVDPLIRIFPER